MSNEPKMSMIHSALIEISREVGPIARDGRNKDQNFDYRKIETVLNRLQPLLAKHGVIMIPKLHEHSQEDITFRGGGKGTHAVVAVDYVFAAADGSSVTVRTTGECANSSDKSSGIAQTYAHKVALLQLFNIPYKDHDPDATSPQWRKQERLEQQEVTVKEVTALKVAWRDSIPADERGAPLEMATKFMDWVSSVIGVEIDVNQLRAWDRDSLEACQKALSNAPATE